MALTTDQLKKYWDSANLLRKNLDAAEYKHIVLGLVFLKYVSDSFAERRDELSEAFSDPKNPAKVTDKKALSKLTEMMTSGALGFAPAGILAPKKFIGKHLQGMPEAVNVGGSMQPFSTDQRIVDVAGRYMADKKSM